MGKRVERCLLQISEKLNDNITKINNLDLLKCDAHVIIISFEFFL